LRAANPKAGLYFTVMNTAKESRRASLAIELREAAHHPVRSLLGSPVTKTASGIALELAPAAVEFPAVGERMK